MKFVLIRLIIIAFVFIYSVFMLTFFNSKKTLTYNSSILFFFGAIAFFSVFFIQNPLQSLLGKTIVGGMIDSTSKAFLYALVEGFVQEIFKVLPAFFGNDKIFAGASTGAGFGFIGAIIILVHNSTFSITFLIIQLIVILFHISSTSIVMYGKEKGKFLFYYIVMAIVHAILATFIIIHNIGFISESTTALIVAFISIPLFTLSIWLYKRTLIA